METRSILVEVREWSDKTFGNTYWSSRIWVNGERWCVLTFRYGYEDHGVYESIKELVLNGILPTECNGRGWGYIKDLGIDFYYTKSKALKREMFKRWN